jgi:YidC/Oxa1 family membrane protein insertase
VDRNFFLAFALSFLVLTAWAIWQGEHRARNIPPGEGAVVETPAPEDESSPEGSSVPAPAPVLAPAAKTTPLRSTPVAPSPPLPESPEKVEKVETSLFSAELSTWGAGLTSWTLAQYRDHSTEGWPAVELTTLAADQVALATPFPELGLGDLSRAPFRVERRGPLDLGFRYESAGIVVRKVYTFDDESYAFRLRIAVDNGSDRVIEPAFEAEWPEHVRRNPDFADQMLIALAEGDVERAAVATVGKPGFFSRIFGGDQGGPPSFPSEVDWAGAQTRYFLSVLLPDVPREASARFEPVVAGESARTVLGFQPVRLPPGQGLEREYRVYIGPKEVERLEAVGGQLDRSINRGYAWVAPLTAAFSWMLRASYSVIPNYGVAIILITVLVRLGTAPLMAKQMRSMRRMGELQPKMKALQEKYADDRQKQSEELMKLYRQSGVNPLGGCFPMLLQFPVFIGLYYALQSSIDLRQEPFMLWIRDLSAPESLFTIPGLEIPVRVLPLLMGVSMVLQQKLTPTSVDPAQARMMMTVMPVMFTVLFYQFPSGLVLYWFVSNLLGIGHQLWVNRGPGSPARKGPKEKG